MKTEKEIYEYLRRELGRFEPVDPEGQTEFDWVLTKVARELSTE